MTADECKQVIGDSRNTFYKIAAGVKEGVSAGRYPTCAITDIGKKVDVSVLAYLDYRTNMDMLSSKKNAKYAEPYKPKEIEAHYRDVVEALTIVKAGESNSKIIETLRRINEDPEIKKVLEALMIIGKSDGKMEIRMRI